MSAHLTPELRSESLIEALPYIQEFRGHTFVIKYGGAAMEDDQIVEKFLRDVVFLEAVGINPVLVHGGGKAITARMREAGLKAQFVNGLRVTDGVAIRIVEETLDGEINTAIVRSLQEFGGRATGFSGKTVFRARRLPAQTGENGEAVEIGFVGEAASMDAKEIRAALRKETVPVIPSVTAGQVESLIRQKVIAGGMIPKVQSAAAALKNGVKKTHLIGGQIQHCLLLEIFTNAGIGSEIVP